MKIEKDRKEIVQVLLSCVGIFLVSLGLYSTIAYKGGDDQLYLGWVKEKSLAEYLHFVYYGFSRRLTCEAAVWLTYSFGKLFGDICNSTVVVLFIYGLYRIVWLITKEEKRWILFMKICIAICLLDTMVLGYSILWRAGAMNYLYSITPMIWGAYFALELLVEQEKKWLHLVVMILCTILTAASGEQFFPILAWILLYFVIILFKKDKKGSIIIAIDLVIGIISFRLSCLSPGFMARASQQSVQAYDLAAISTLHHIYLTIQWLFSAMINDSKILMIALCEILGIGLKKLGKKDWWISIAFAGLLIMSVLPPLNWLTYVGIKPCSLNSATTVVELAYYSQLDLYNKILFIVVGIMLLYILIGVYRVGLDKERAIGFDVLYTGALGSCLMLYFTSSMYESGSRVYFLLQVLFAVMILLMNKFKERYSRWFWGHLLILQIFLNAGSVYLYYTTR